MGGSHRTQHTRPRVARATKAGPWEKTLPTAAPQAAAPARDLPLASRDRAPPGSGCAHDRPLLPFPFQLTFSTSAAVQARRAHTDSLQSEGACTGKRAKNRKWLRGSSAPIIKVFRDYGRRPGARGSGQLRAHGRTRRPRTSSGNAPRPSPPCPSAAPAARLCSARLGAARGREPQRRAARPPPPHPTRPGDRPRRAPHSREPGGRCPPRGSRPQGDQRAAAGEQPAQPRARDPRGRCASSAGR